MIEHEVPMWDETPEERAAILAARRKDAAEKMSQAYEAQLAAAKMTDRAVYLAREAGLSWAEIGEAMRVTRQAAHQRFRHVETWRKADG